MGVYTPVKVDSREAFSVSREGTFQVGFGRYFYRVFFGLRGKPEVGEEERMRG